MTEINFNNLRSHDNSKNKAFEELCSQLARLEFRDQCGWVFTKKGGSSDGGLECYWAGFYGSCHEGPLAIKSAI